MLYNNYSQSKEIGTSQFFGTNNEYCTAELGSVLSKFPHVGFQGIWVGCMFPPWDKQVLIVGPPDGVNLQSPYGNTVDNVFDWNDIVAVLVSDKSSVP